MRGDVLKVLQQFSVVWNVNCKMSSKKLTKKKKLHSFASIVKSGTYSAINVFSLFSLFSVRAQEHMQKYANGFTK